MNDIQDFMKDIMKSALKEFTVRIYEPNKTVYTEKKTILIHLLIQLIHSNDKVDHIRIYQKEV